MATIWQQNSDLYSRYIRNLAIMYQKRQDIRAFTELLLSLSVIAIFGIFAIRPTLVTIAGLNVQISDKQDTLNKLDAKINALLEAQTLYDSNLGVIELLNQTIPTAPLIDTYVRQVEGLAKRHSVSILSMNTGEIYLIGTPPPPTAATDTAVPGLIPEDFFPPESQGIRFDIDLTGDYPAIEAFLRDLENLRRPLYADNLAINASQQGELSGQISISISGRLAYLPIINLQNTSTIIP